MVGGVGSAQQHLLHNHHHLLHHHHLHHQQHQHHQQQQQQQQHDSSSKRVKTEQTFESLFDKETHSDVTISVNGDECVFHAHRMILGMKSEVLAAMLANLSDKPRGGGEGEGEEEMVVVVVAGGGLGVGVGGGGGGCRRPGVPVLRVREDPECSHVFSRFLYFLYSGAVWLHQDYVLPLFRLAHKYGVRPLRTHCQTYILQVLAKSCGSTPSSSLSSSSAAASSSHHHHHPHPNNRSHHNHNNNNNHNVTNHNHSPPNTLLTSSPSSASSPSPSPNANSPPYSGSGFRLEVVCDLYEGEAYEGDVQQTAFRLLCCQFRQLVRTERWLRLGVRALCRLIASDSCHVEENLILVSATDYMKRTNLSDKRQIEDILSRVRYPRLNRRVLYHLQKNGSFKNFPHIQELMLGAMRYHSFKDLPEARGDFVGAQFRPRMGSSGGGGGGGSSPNRRASMHVAAVTDGYPETTTVFSEAAYSLEPVAVVVASSPSPSPSPSPAPPPVTLTRSRQSQV